MVSKNERIIHHIQSLPVGSKISVRGLAKDLQVSEGTAYRAIKDAEDNGLVSTIERVGTIRIEQKKNFSDANLTFEDIIDLIDGEVLGGQAGLKNPLNKFIIGAMTTQAMEKYFEPNSLMIVGNRYEVQHLCLKKGMAVLITGGFIAEPNLIAMANQSKLPLLSTPYDTFTVATLINRSINESNLKKRIVTVEEVYTPIEETLYLHPTDTVEDFNRKSASSGHSRFPVVHNQRLVGVITANDLMGRGDRTSIEKAMSRRLITVKPHMSVASVSYKMVWEDIEMIPVVADNLQLLGVISRQDIMKALQNLQQQDQVMTSYESELFSYLETKNPNMFHDPYDYHLEVQPQMVNTFGTISYGNLSALLVQVAIQTVQEKTGHDNILETLNLHYFTFIQLGNRVDFKVKILNANRRSAVTEVEVHVENVLVAKAMVGTQMINKRQRS